jgi:hypothetical protein
MDHKDLPEMRISRLEARPGLEFGAAQALAKAEAGRSLDEPMILSWLDRRAGRHSPDVDCCGDGGKEAWEIYAESRGGAVRVEVGDEYVFIFREGSLARH